MKILQNSLEIVPKKYEKILMGLGYGGGGGSVLGKDTYVGGARTDSSIFGLKL
jgi:hypothetical protein